MWKCVVTVVSALRLTRAFRRRRRRRRHRHMPFTAPPPCPPVVVLRRDASPSPSPDDIELHHANFSVHLLGPGPDNLFIAFLGEYSIRGHVHHKMNGRYIYAQQGSPDRWLWYSGAFWLVGPAEDCHTDPRRARGWLRAHDRAVRPESISAKWEAGDGRMGWLQAPSLRMSTGDEAEQASLAHAAALREELAGAAGSVMLVGATPCEMWRGWLGVYDLMHSHPLINARHVYRQRDRADRWLWYGDGVYCDSTQPETRGPTHMVHSCGTLCDPPSLLLFSLFSHTGNPLTRSGAQLRVPAALKPSPYPEP